MWSSRARSNGRDEWRRRHVLPAVAVGAAAVAVVMYEHRVLSGLDATPDPETDDGLRFPSERSHRIPVSDDGHVHVEECGSGRPVVLLHGHGANLGIFALLATRLAAGGRRVVAFDHRGFGRSSTAPAAFDFRGLVDDVAAVLDRLDLHDAIVVGHSMGGAVALGLAVRRPEVTSARVSGAVMINSTATGPADGPLPRAKATALDWGLTEHVGRHPRHGVALTRANFGAEPLRSHVVAVRTLGFDSPAVLRVGLTRRLLGVDLSGRLDEVGIPVLVLAGELDRVLPVSQSKRLAESIADAQLETFPGAGHVLPVECSAEVAASILRFADDVDTRGERVVASAAGHP